MIRTVFTRALQSSKYLCTARTAAISQSNIQPSLDVPFSNSVSLRNSTRYFSDESTESPPPAPNTPGKGGGTVKWFDVKKGFGFIEPSDGTPDIFVHHSVVHAKGFRSLADGEEVEYESSVDDRGRLFASSVTGPDGDFVQGAPRQFDRPFGSNDSFGGGGGGGFDNFGGGGGFGNNYGDNGAGGNNDKW